MRRLERNIFPQLGVRPIADIAAPDLLAVIRRIENRGVLETAHRALATCGQVFRYALVTGRAERDPSRDLRGALSPVKGEHFAAITDPKQVGHPSSSKRDEQHTPSRPSATNESMSLGKLVLLGDSPLPTHSCRSPAINGTK